MSDGALHRLVPTEKVKPYLTSIAQKKAGGMNLSSGEQRLLNILCNSALAYDFWNDEQWDAQQRIVSEAVRQ
jgi:hypothetical protein